MIWEVGGEIRRLPTSIETPAKEFFHLHFVDVILATRCRFVGGHLLLRSPSPYLSQIKSENRTLGNVL